jgi:membrane-bound metal-dependent hydrolase YbcI (DUF457 family)
MPSPVGHALVALSLHALTARNQREAASVTRAAVFVGAALAPDLDLLLRFVDGRNHHQTQSHSIGAAVIAGLLAWGVAWMRGTREPGRWAGLVTIAWTSHLALDYLGRDTHPPIGLMALWPLSSGYFKSPWALFMDIGRTLEWSTVRHNAVAVGWEVALLAPLFVLCWRLRPSQRPE